MRSSALLLVSFVVTGLAAGCDDGGGSEGAGDDAGSASPEPAASAERGRVHYDQYCAFCHGAQGEGYASDQANALNNPTFLSTATDEFLTVGTTMGRPGTPMSGWGDVVGGPLSDADVADVVALIRSWQTEPILEVHADVVEGVAMRGRPLYNARCAECHGDDGEGGTYISLANPWFLDSASDGFLLHAIESGRPGTPMPGFGDELSAQNAADLVALLRSWAVPPGQPPAAADPPDLSAAVLNEGGATASFSLREDRYAAADDVLAALESGAELVFLDARPPADYAESHITGAVSLPFYDVEAYASDLPDDVWIIAYCGCPHAISNQAADVLFELGFESVAVLDEGFYVWEERGYPVTYGQSE